MNNTELPDDVNTKSALPDKFIRHPVHFLALGFGLGCVPKLPGTAGTLAGVVFYFGLQLFNVVIYLSITLFLLLIGIWLCDRTARDLGVHDHPAIVWDEITGYLITMILAPQGWIWAAAGFIAFRFFDICKPWPVSWADKKVAGGLGIMLDDVIAGIYGLVTLQIIAYML